MLIPTHAPFLKVYNVEGQERTTRDIALPPSLEPDFYQSFELSAILPGQSRLHLEVCEIQSRLHLEEGFDPIPQHARAHHGARPHRYGTTSC